jgi:hypothetical protein
MSTHVNTWVLIPDLIWYAGSVRLAGGRWPVVLICHERRIPLASLPATVSFREGSIAACMPGGCFLSFFFIIENIPYRDDMAREQAKNLFRHICM